ncbi:MAG: glycosyltransferase [Phycisphaerales bacterium]|nr:MAG: glycosyltransferase [Phycisphaerales bacterium]
MRIALVHASFTPELGYESTVWYRKFLDMGHHVRVFSTTHVNTSVRHLYDRPLPEGLITQDGGEVHRLPARRLPRDLLVCPLLAPAVQEFRPDLTLLVGVTNTFGSSLLKNRGSLSGVVFCSFGENHAQRRTALPATLEVLRGLALDAAFLALKRRLVRRAIETTDATLLNTPDTFDYLLPRVATARQRERLRSKCALFPLGFDPSLFRVDTDARQDTRRRLGIADHEVAGLYSCKVTPIKRLDVWVSVMAAAMRRAPALRAVLVGIREGDPESRRIVSLVGGSGLQDRFTCLPFASRTELPRLYNAADFGVWHRQPSITIQEAMGTGLYMILTNDSTVSHLLLEPETGRYFVHDDTRDLEERVVETARAFADNEVVSHVEARRQRAEINARRFGYDVLAERIITAAKDPPNAVDHLQFRDDYARELCRERPG